MFPKTRKAFFMKIKLIAARLILFIAMTYCDVPSVEVFAAQTEYVNENFDNYSDQTLTKAWTVSGGAISLSDDAAFKKSIKVTTNSSSEATAKYVFSKPVTDLKYTIEFWVKADNGFDIGGIMSDGKTVQIIGMNTVYSNKVGCYKSGAGRLSWGEADTSIATGLSGWSRIIIDVDREKSSYTIKTPGGSFAVQYTADLGDLYGLILTASKKNNGVNTLLTDGIKVYDFEESKTYTATLSAESGGIKSENLGYETKVDTRSDYFVLKSSALDSSSGLYDVTPSKGTIKIDLDDHMPSSGKNREDISVKITYRDADYGWFMLNYSTADGMKSMDAVTTKQTGDVLTCEFFLSDAEFNIASNDCDLSIVSHNNLTKNYSNISYNSNFSKGWIYISKIEVAKAATSAPYDIDITSDNTGNIFFCNELPEFDVSYSLAAESVKRLKAEYSIYKYDDDMNSTALYTLKSSGSIVDGSTIKVCAPVEDYGLYEFEVRVMGQDGKLVQKYSVPFSKCVMNTSKNPNVGICVHFTRYGDTENGLKLIKNAGFGLIRDDFEWINYETQKGVYKLKERQEKVLNGAKQNNLEILPILSGNNINYCKEDTDSWSLVSDKYIENFKDYIRNIVREEAFADVKTVEIINEPDLMKEIDGVSGYDRETMARTFAKNLMAAYDVIKEVRPDISVGGFSLSGGIQEDKMKAFVDYAFDEIGNRKAFDNFTLHPYMYNDDPEPGYYGQDSDAEDATFAQRVNYYRGLMNGSTVGTITGNRYSLNNNSPMWHTETGWSSSYDPDQLCVKTQREQALRDIRVLDAARVNGFSDKVWLYQFSGMGERENEKEFNFDLVRSEKHKVPYSAKYAYLAVANYNKLTANAKSVSQTEPKKFVFNSEYNCGDTKVNMLWSTGGDTEVDLEFDKSTVYVDLYGNILDKSEVFGSNGGYAVTSQPYYAVTGNTEEYQNKKVNLYVKNGDFIVSEPTLSDINANNIGILIDFNDVDFVNANLMCGFYKNGILAYIESVDCTKGAESDGESIYSFVGLENKCKNPDEIRIFLIEDDTLRPICESVKITS